MGAPKGVHYERLLAAIVTVFLFGLMLAAPVHAGKGGVEGPPTVRLSGNSASAWFGTEDVFGDVSVWEVNRLPSEDPASWMQLFLVSWSGEPHEGELEEECLFHGYGFVPAEVVDFSKDAMSVRVDTLDLRNLTDFEVLCGSLDGLVDVTIAKPSTQTLSYEFSGREVRTFISCEGDEFVMYTRVGKWKDSSADATGTALGFDVTEGSMSIHHGVTLTFGGDIIGSPGG